MFYWFPKCTAIPVLQNRYYKKQQCINLKRIVDQPYKPITSVVVLGDCLMHTK